VVLGFKPSDTGNVQPTYAKKRQSRASQFAAAAIEVNDTLALHTPMPTTTHQQHRFRPIRKPP
jgi:hypothetical protein